MPGFLSDVLSQPHNFELTMAVEAAVKMSMPPTSLLMPQAQPGDDWTMEDKKLVIAYHALQKQKCGQCKEPLWICRSQDRYLDFSVRKETCYVTKAMEDQKKKDEKNKSSQLKNGQYYYVVPIMRGDRELPSRSNWLDDLKED